MSAPRRDGDDDGGHDGRRARAAQPTRSVAAVAAASVDGYLRNASRRMRVPAAEGGRGTRRKLDMVTSAHDQQQQQQHDDAAEAQAQQAARDERARTAEADNDNDDNDGDDEWDAVELVGSTGGVTASHKRESAAHASKHDEGGGAKLEMTAAAADSGGGGALPRIKDEAAQHSATAATLPIPQQPQPPPAATVVKSERLDGSVAAALRHDDDDDNGGDGLTMMMMPGARRPLTGQAQDAVSSASGYAGAAAAAWQRADPAYAAMIEQRDALAAQRRSQRMQRASYQMAQLLVLLVRARHLWRATHHPRLVRSVLRLRADDDDDTDKKRNNDDDDDNNNNDDNDEDARGRDTVARPDRRSRPPRHRRLPPPRSAATAHGGGRRVLHDAVTRARALVDEARREAALQRPSLAPTWVTPSRDGLGNRTSRAVQVLLTALNDYFVVQAGETNNDGDGDADEQAERQPQAAGDGASTTPTTSSSSSTTSWSCPLQPGTLERLLRARHYRVGDKARRVPLPHPLYMSLLFITLASLAGLHCRLVTAVAHEHNSSNSNATTQQPERATSDTAASAGTATRRGGDTSFLAKMSLFMDGRGGRGGGAAATRARGRGGRRGSSTSSAHDTAPVERTSRRLPSSCFWAEVWCRERACYVAVNPCRGFATLWGAPYTFAVDGDTAVDVTPRYTSRYSAAFAYGRRLGRVRQYGFLWKDKTTTWDDNRDVVELLLAPFRLYNNKSSSNNNTDNNDNNSSNNRVVAAALHRYARERRQLEALMYAEPVPTTLNALHHHPLFVIESDLARHEGVYPKDATTTVGSVKGHMVYKRAAVVSLRSRDGWLREGRSVRAGELPYKTMPPPSSRPFAAPSQFYGVWQTQPFAPLPLLPDGTLPRHGRTSWYILLDQPPPPGVVRMGEPQMARVARRMQLDFAHAVTAFVRRRVNERRRGRWEAVLDGIVVKASDAAPLSRAYAEWVQLVQEQEAAKRRQRALQWWLLLTQRALAMDRLQSQYLQGMAHGPLPSM